MQECKTNLMNSPFNSLSAIPTFYSELLICVPIEINEILFSWVVLLYLLFQHLYLVHVIFKTYLRWCHFQSFANCYLMLNQYYILPVWCDCFLDRLPVLILIFSETNIWSSTQNKEIFQIYKYDHTSCPLFLG